MTHKFDSIRNSFGGQVFKLSAKGLFFRTEDGELVPDSKVSLINIDNGRYSAYHFSEEVNRVHSGALTFNKLRKLAPLDARESEEIKLGLDDKILSEIKNLALKRRSEIGEHHVCSKCAWISHVMVKTGQAADALDQSDEFFRSSLLDLAAAVFESIVNIDRNTISGDGL